MRLSIWCIWIERTAKKTSSSIHLLIFTHPVLIFFSFLFAGIKKSCSEGNPKMHYCQNKYLTHWSHPKMNANEPMFLIRSTYLRTILRSCFMDWWSCFHTCISSSRACSCCHRSRNWSLVALRVLGLLHSGHSSCISSHIWVALIQSKTSPSATKTKNQVTNCP